MAYGSVKVDTIIFDDNGSDQNVTVSGLYRATTSGVTVSGTIAAGTVSGVTVIGSTTVSGATVTGTTANFTSGNFSNLISAAATMSGALIMANQQQVQFREAVGNGVNHIALQAPAIVSADQTITLPDQTGTVITTGDNGSVSSTMLATNLTISAAAGSAAAPSIAFTDDLNTGIYSPGADQLAVSTGGTGRLFVDASGDVTISDKIIHAGDTDTAIRFPAADTVSVETDGSERLRIKSDGELFLAANNTTSAVTINQTGTGNALVVEDSSNPDATPFVIDQTGRSVQGHTVALSLNGTGGTPTCQLNAPASSLFAGACYSAVSWSDSVAAPGIFLAKARADAVGTYTAVPNNQNLGEVRFAGADGSQFQLAASIRVESDGTPSTGIVPGRIFFQTANSSGTLTEAMRITSTGAVLVGATAAPTDVADGDIALQNRLVMNASASNYGQFQRIADVGANITATTGTIVFKFKSALSGSHRSAFVKINLSGRSNNGTPSNSPACEYAFQLHQTSGGVCSINGTTTIFEYTFVRATHFAFANLGSGECTVTLTTPTSASITPAYMVEINSQAGAFGLDAVTIT
jgi:hypothetical protein